MKMEGALRRGRKMHRPDVCGAIGLIDAGGSERAGGCRGGDVCRLREREEGGCRAVRGAGGVKRMNTRMKRLMERQKGGEQDEEDGDDVLQEKKKDSKD